MNKAEQWLFDQLKGKECVLVDIIRAAAKEAGIKKPELKAARQALGVKTYHQFDTKGDTKELEATENWFWFLPDYGISQA